MKFDRFDHQIFLAGKQLSLSHFWSVETFIPGAKKIKIQVQMSSQNNEDLIILN